MQIRSSLIVLIVIVLLFLISCGPEPFSIESITISKGIGEDFAPIDPMDVFPAGTSIIFIIIKVKNISLEDKLTVIWTYLETGDVMKTIDSNPEEAKSGNIVFNLKHKNDKGFPQGDYNAEIYINDELYETIEFSVR